MNQLNTYQATANEIFICKEISRATHSNISSHTDSILNTKLLESKFYLKDVLYHNIEMLSVSMARECLEYIENNFKKLKIVDIEWFAGKDHRNPSDIRLTFSNGNYFGISCKCSKHSHRIGFKNYSYNTILNSHLGLGKYKDILDIHERNILNHYNLNDLSKKERKQYIRNDCDIKEKLFIHNHSRMIFLRNVFYEHLNQRNNLNDYISRYWIQNNEDIFPYLKCFGNILTKETLTENIHCSKSIKIFKNSKLSLSKSSEYSISLSDKKQKLFSFNVSNNSEPFCSILRVTASL